MKLFLAKMHSGHSVAVIASALRDAVMALDDLADELPSPDGSKPSAATIEEVPFDAMVVAQNMKRGVIA